MLPWPAEEVLWIVQAMYTFKLELSDDAEQILMVATALQVQTFCTFASSKCTCAFPARLL